MKNRNQLLPLLLCFVLALSAASFGFRAYAADADSASPSSENGDSEDGSGESANTGMFDTTVELGKTLMSGIWSLFGIYVPGFSFTFGQMWLGVLLASVSILVIRMIFGFGASGGSGSVSPRTGSTNNPKISKERRRDEY